MATREENIKKINDLLEQLSDEELENVAGGNRYQTSLDSYFLHDMGLMNETYDVLIANWKSGSKAIDAAWAKAGVTSYTDHFGGNKYWIKEENNRQVSREDAMKYVANKLGKSFNINDYVETEWYDL